MSAKKFLKLSWQILFICFIASLVSEKSIFDKILHIGLVRILFDTIVFGLLFYFFFLLYDITIMKLYDFFDFFIRQTGRFAIKKKCTYLALLMIRVDYYHWRINSFLRLNWVVFGSSNLNNVWMGLSKSSISQKVLVLFKILISIPLEFSLLFVCYLLKILDIDFFTKIKNDLIVLFQFKVNLSEIFSSLPTLVTLLTLIPVVFFFYFYSQRREARKVIDKETSQYFKEVVLLYERLLLWINRNIYVISENFDYVIRNQDLIVDILLEKQISNYRDLNDKYYSKLERVKSYPFINSSKIETKELNKIVNGLTCKKLDRFTRSFSAKKYDIWRLYCLLKSYELRDRKSINMTFYTQEGLINRISNQSQYTNQCTMEEMEQRKNAEFRYLTWTIYEDLQILYRLKRGHDILRKYLYSSRLEELILKVFDKKG